MPGIRTYLKCCVPTRLHPLVRSLMGQQNGASLHYCTVSQYGASSTNEWIRKSASIDGWLYEGEHEYLWDLACRDQIGNILEVGTWMGKSTCILGGACIEFAPKTKVICVDTFTLTGTPHQEVIQKTLLKGAPGTFYEFLANARRCNFYGSIVPLATLSRIAISIIPDSLRMVFLDGTHDWKGLADDVQLCLPKLKPGGVLAIHDTSGTSWPDIRRYVDSELCTSPYLRHLGERGTITAFEKVAPVEQTDSI